MTTIALAAVFAAALPLIAHAAPKAEFSTLNWDFGEIYQWTNPSITVSIKNTGDEDLKVLDIKPSCGCTTAFMSDKVIRPGDKGFLKVDFLSYNSVGRIRKVVQVITNDPAAKSTNINVAGLVKGDKGAYGIIEPDSVDLGVVAPRETRYVEFILRNKGNIDLLVKGLDLPEGCFLDSGYPDKVPPRGSVTMRVGCAPKTDKGPINDTVIVRTANSREEMKLSLTGYVSETGRRDNSVILTPTRFKVYTDGIERTLELNVVNEGEGEVILEDVDSSLGGEAPTLSAPELAPGESGKVRLRINSDGLEPGMKGYLYLRLAVPIEVEEPGDR